MGNQIVICSTFAENDPDVVIRRDGVVEGFREGGRIAIENVGPVVRAANGDFYPAVLDCDGRKWLADESREPVRVPYEFCSCSPYRGCQHWEMVGDKQLASLRVLVKDMMTERGMSFRYDNQLGDVCPGALRGNDGIFFASSFDKRRMDIHPQVEILNMIKSLAI